MWGSFGPWIGRIYLWTELHVCCEWLACQPCASVCCESTNLNPASLHLYSLSAELYFSMHAISFIELVFCLSFLFKNPASLHLYSLSSELYFSLHAISFIELIFLLIISVLTFVGFTNSLVQQGNFVKIAKFCSQLTLVVLVLSLSANITHTLNHPFYFETGRYGLESSHMSLHMVSVKWQPFNFKRLIFVVNSKIWSFIWTL